MKTIVTRLILTPAMCCCRGIWKKPISLAAQSKSHNSRSIALRLAINFPNDASILGGYQFAYPGLPGELDIPVQCYIDGKKVCLEYDYAKALPFMQDWHGHLGEWYGNDPLLYCVEGPGIGQFGEGTRHLLDAYLGVKKDICSFDTQRSIMASIMKAFPNKPVCVRYLTAPSHDKFSFYVGHDFTLNTYDDVLCHPNSGILQAQIAVSNAKDAIHGGEIYPALREQVLNDPTQLLKTIKERPLSYLSLDGVTPANDLQKANYRLICEAMESAV